MKNLSLSVLFISLSTFSFGQLILSPDFIEIPEVDIEAFETVAYSTVTSEFSGPTNVTWIRTEVAVTETWATAVCDLNQCYLEFVSSETFQLGPGAQSNIDVHVYPNNTEGSAVVQIALVASAAPTDTVYGMYLFNTTLGTKERLMDHIRVFPNPTTDYLQIASGYDVHTIEVYSLEGRMVKQEIVAGSTSVNVSQLSSGTYILRMRSRDGALMSSNVWVKQ